MGSGVRTYRPGDAEPLLDCWRAAAPLEAPERREFERRTLLDDSFDPEGLLVSEAADGSIRGFISCFVLKRPLDKDGMFPDRGFVQVFAVRPCPDDTWSDTQHQTASDLWTAALAFFQARRRTEVVLSPYTPNYYYAGVDVDRSKALLEFLQSRGMEISSEALAADAPLGRFEIPPDTLQHEQTLREQGIVVRPCRPDDITAFLAFLQAHMPGPWVEDARRNLREFTHGRYPLEAIHLAVQNDREIVGYCQHEGEHFGPFGVIDALQGKGVGGILLARTMERMRRAGCHSAWVLWTSDRALQGVYGRLGFTLTRRFAILRGSIPATS